MGTLPSRFACIKNIITLMAKNDPTKPSQEEHTAPSTLASSTSSAETLRRLVLNAGTTATSVTAPSIPLKSDNNTSSILRSTAAGVEGNIVDDLDHLYGPSQLDPAYLASLFPALASTIPTSSLSSNAVTTGSQHVSTTTAALATDATSVGIYAFPPSTGQTQPSSSQSVFPALSSSGWDSDSNMAQLEQSEQWMQPAKKLRDKETEEDERHTPLKDAEGDIQLAEPGGKEGDETQQNQQQQKQQQQQEQQHNDANKATFYQALDYMRMLEVPEIISCIFEFLDKPSLASASRVSRLWRTYCTPLIWRHVVDRNWRQSTFCGLIRSRSRWVRTIHAEMSTDYDMLLSCGMEYLTAISFKGGHDSIETKMAICHKASKHLTSLSLNAMSTHLTTNVARVIQDLQKLSVLKITRTSISGAFLQMVFEGCHELEFLSLRGITFDNSLSTTDESGGANPLSKALRQSPSKTRILYLNLRNVQLQDEDLVEIVKACPELLELSIAGNSSLQNFTDLAKALRQYCPQLYALDVGSCVEISDDHFTALWSILGPQLKIVNLAGTKLKDKELVLLARECQSLTRLDIQYCTDITTQGLHEFMCTVGSTLQQLEASGLTIDPEQIDDRKWTCTGLEVLFIHVNLFDRRRLSPTRLQDLLTMLQTKNESYHSSIDGKTSDDNSTTDSSSCSNVARDKIAEALLEAAKSAAAAADLASEFHERIQRQGAQLNIVSDSNISKDTTSNGRSNGTVVSVIIPGGGPSTSPNEEAEDVVMESPPNNDNSNDVCVASEVYSIVADAEKRTVTEKNRFAVEVDRPPADGLSIIAENSRLVSECYNLATNVAAKANLTVSKESSSTSARNSTAVTTDGINLANTRSTTVDSSLVESIRLAAEKTIAVYAQYMEKKQTEALATTINSTRTYGADAMQQDTPPPTNPAEATEMALQRYRRHPFHPVQQLTKLHYLGLMGMGAKLLESSVGSFIDAFPHVDHLDLSGLSQAFHEADLRWLIESLPSLYQIEAEHFHISDDLRKWCRKTYPEIVVSRKGH